MTQRILLIFLLIIVACNSDTDPVIDFDVKQLRSDFIQYIETPATNNLIDEIDGLNRNIINFTADATNSNLESLKHSWKNTAMAYSYIEALNIGEISNSFIHTAFFSWDANENAIENYITSSKSISENEINLQSTNSRGLSAIEFLLFDKTPDRTIISFSNQRREEYLKILGKNLKTKATLLDELWNTYRPIFIENTETGINGGVNRIVNQINVLLEKIKRFKIGEPAGIEKAIVVDVLKLQADKSGFSLALIKKNLELLKNIYFLKNSGLDDYIKAITKNDELNTKIQNQFIIIENHISEIKTPLKTAISSDKLKVKNLYNSIGKLIRLIKVDVARALSITITFTDSDGD